MSKQAQLFRRPFFPLIIACAAALGSPAARADTYPAKPVRIIFPFGPGGGGDFIARFIAQQLTAALGQTMIVENHPGAGGVIGTDLAGRAPSDGYTLLLISNTYTVNASVYPIKFDARKDMTPIVLLDAGPLVLVANPSFPAHTTRDLIRLARQKPGAIDYSSGGVGTMVHLAGALFADMAQVKMTHVPYKGTGAAVTGLLVGEVAVCFSSAAPAIRQIKAGRLRPIAVTGSERLAALPNVPTVSESGVAGYDIILWHGMLGPKSLPREIVERLNGEVNKILQLAETRSMLNGQGVSPVGGSPEQFARQIDKELVLWKQVVERAGIKPR